MITHSISLIGRRESNEDKHLDIKNLDSKNKQIKRMSIFSVFDGHGGKEISHFLGKNYYKFFTGKVLSYSKNSSSAFKKYVNKVHDLIQHKLESRFKNISYSVGSTALSIMFFKHKDQIFYYVVNVGDSRAVLCNGNDKPVALSIDHKPNTEKERKRIMGLPGAYIYNEDGVYRVAGLSVSRSFGDMDAKPFISHSPEIRKFSLDKKDKFIILACDGLWDVMTNRQAVNFVLNELKHVTKLEDNSTHNKKNIAKNLAQEAIRIGSYDNVSIIIIFF